MSKVKRKRYSVEFMAKVALEAIKAEATIAEIATKFGIHPNQVTDWKKEAMEGMVEVFMGKTEWHRVENEPQIKELHAKIGQLTAERAIQWGQPHSEFLNYSILIPVSCQCKTRMTQFGSPADSPLICI